MDFHLFAKKKDSEEIKQAQDVKFATQENSNVSAPAFNAEFNNEPFGDINNNQTQNNFNNPFAQNNDENKLMETNNNNNNNNENRNNSNLNNGNNSLNNNENNTQNKNNPFEVPNTNDINNSNNNNNNQSFENLQNSLNGSSFSREEIQELIDETVEKVIEERWKELVSKVDKVVSWKDKQESQINLIKEDVITMRDGLSRLEKRLITKIESYDKNILDVNSEIKALEKVFQKITPTLVNNINELSKITKGLKESKNNNNNSYDKNDYDSDKNIA